MGTAAVESRKNPARHASRRQARYEVFPARTTPVEAVQDGIPPEVKHYVRVRAVNGGKWFTSDPYDTKSNAVAAARSANRSVSFGRLEILVLDAEGGVERIIEPKPVPVPPLPLVTAAR